MYIITCLGIVKLYQNRHPDIAAHAHTVYTGFALIILIAVMGVVSRNLHLWNTESIPFFNLCRLSRDVRKTCLEITLDLKSHQGSKVKTTENFS